jgi:hypothetical protein
MDLSSVRVLGLSVVDLAVVVTAVLAIPPLFVIFGKRSRKPKDLETPSGLATAGTANTKPPASGCPQSAVTAESLNTLSKALIAAPVIYTATQLVAEVAKDRFSDTALDAISLQTYDAAAHAAGSLAVHSADAADAADALHGTIMATPSAEHLDPTHAANAIDVLKEFLL